MSAGYFLVGMAVGLVLGALASYGAMFAWAIHSGKKEDKEDRE